MKKKRKRYEKLSIRNKISNKISRWKKETPNSDITVDYLCDLYEKQEGKCYYTGELMEWNMSKVQNNSLSLDRLDPDKGYMQGNLVFCCYKINSMKWNSNEKEFYQIMLQILKHKGVIND